MENRIEVYKKSGEKHPERWSKDIGNWGLSEYVTLNPVTEDEAKDLLNKSR